MVATKTRLGGLVAVVLVPKLIGTMKIGEHQKNDTKADNIQGNRMSDQHAIAAELEAVKLATRALISEVDGLDGICDMPYPNAVSLAQTVNNLRELAGVSTAFELSARKLRLDPHPESAVERMPARVLQLWEIDGEDLIVAKSEVDMRAIFMDYHGETILGRDRRLVPPDEEIELTDGDETWKQPAHEIASSRGYFVACR